MNRYAGITFYRTEVSPGLTTFRVVVKQTDLFILAERDLTEEAVKVVREVRTPLEQYIFKNPVFLKSLLPLPFDPEAPEIVKTMLRAGEKAGVGPMASVAGAIAEAVGRELLRRELTKVIAVENGGDIFLSLKRDGKVKVFAGNTVFSELTILVPEELQPCGVCTSSGKIGHSLSLGKADAITVVAKDTAYADALATALGNILREKRDLKLLESEVKRREGILGVIAILEDKAFLWGKIKIV
jgi:ApbE superfamily uncharacterized protein (UPF0280 family)